MNNLLCMALRIVRLPVAITARLRVALAMILLGVVLTGAVAILQAQRILHAYKQLHDTALPLLALSEDSRQTIDLFAATLSSVATQSIDDRLTASPGNISAQTDHVRQSLRALSRYDIPPALLDSLDTRLAMTEATTLKILRDRTAFLGTVILISDPQQRRGTVFRITLPMAPNMQNDNGPNLPSAA